MRKTKKFVAGVVAAKSSGLGLIWSSNEELYEALEDDNFYWKAKAGEWQQLEHKPSTSVFQADDGTPTGIVKIRVMAHPDDVQKAVQKIKATNGLRVIEISEKTYPNRKGTGVRIYVTALLQ